MSKDYLRLAKIVLFRFILIFFSVFRLRRCVRRHCYGCRLRLRCCGHRHCCGCHLSCYDYCFRCCSLGCCFSMMSCYGCSFRCYGCCCCLGCLMTVCSNCRLMTACSRRSLDVRILSWSVMSGCRSVRCSSCGLQRCWRCWDVLKCLPRCWDARCLLQR